jgi:hypothetical protein
LASLDLTVVRRLRSLQVFLSLGFHRLVLVGGGFVTALRSGQISAVLIHPAEPAVDAAGLDGRVVSPVRRGDGLGQSSRVNCHWPRSSLELGEGDRRAIQHAQQDLIKDPDLVRELRRLRLGKLLLFHDVLNLPSLGLLFGLASQFTGLPLSFTPLRGMLLLPVRTAALGHRHPLRLQKTTPRTL